MASDETLLDLLTRAHQLPRLAGVSTLADDAALSNVAPVPATVVGRCGGELEALLALRPDLAVVASYNRPEMLARLGAAGVKTVVLKNFSTLADIEEHVTALGAATGTGSAAQAIVRELQQTVATLAAKAPRQRPAVIEFFPDGTVSGSGTLFDAEVEAAGGVNVAAARGLQGWPRLSAEVLATLAPDAVVASGDSGRRNELLATMRGLPGWQSLAAVKAGRIILVPARELGSASEYVALGIKHLQSALLELPAKTEGRVASPGRSASRAPAP